MFSACAGAFSIASHTLAKRFLLVDLAPLSNPGNAALPGSDLLCVDGVVELRHIQHSKRSRSVANPNFTYPSADCIHRFPVVWLAPTLDLVELISRLTPGRLAWKPSLRPTIQNFVCSGKSRLPLLAERQNHRNIAVPVAVLRGHSGTAMQYRAWSK